MTDRPAPPGRHRATDAMRRTGITLGAAMVATALMTGLNFTFAAAVMPNLRAADDRTFIAITQRFNDNPVFPLIFTSALVLLIAATVLHRRHAPGPGWRWTAATLALYVVVIAITAAVHLPLNTQIDEAGDPAAITDPAQVRDRFESAWVIANIVRTVLATGALGVLARAIFLFGRATAPAPSSGPTDRMAWPPPAASSDPAPQATPMAGR